MTIGSLDASLNAANMNKNIDFEALINCRKILCEKFNLDYKSLELSMGMSHDFEQAVRIIHKKLINSYLYVN